MLTRRELLRRSALVSLAPAVPTFLARTARAAAPDRDDRILVVLQLDGGNDGLNTVVPYGDENYAKHRPKLQHQVDRILKLTDHVGLHPSMRAAADLVEDGRLSIVQGVSYPNPDRSHFRSMAIWQTARFEASDHNGFGWLGRALDGIAPPAGPSTVFVGRADLPRALRSRRAVSTSLADASDLELALPSPSIAGGAGDDLSAFVGRTVSDAYTTAAALAAASERKSDPTARYPATDLARQLELVARTIKAGAAARVYYTIQTGYDTHAVQLPTHARLLSELSNAVKAFLNDLAASQLADRVLLLAFSEFGRRVAENGSIGTDHGTAGPVFLAGSSVRAGLIGETPSLSELVNGDLPWTLDFRRVYATVLTDCLGIPSDSALGGSFEPIPILR